MTLTTGLTPVATATDAAGPRGGARASTRGRRLGWLAGVLDLTSAGVSVLVTAALTPGVALPLFFVVLLAAWPAAVAVAGGYSRMSEDPYALRLRPLLAAGPGIATAAWATLTIAPHVADGQTPRTLAAMTLIFAATSSLTTICARLLLPLVSPRRPLTVVLAGPEREVRELLKEAGRKGRRHEFVPVAVCVPEPTEEPGPDTPRWTVDVWHGVDESLLEAVRAHGAEAVVVAPGAGTTHRELRRWAGWLQDDGVQLLVSPGLRDISAARLGTATLGGARLLRIRPARLRGTGALVKNVVDRVGALLLLVALAPVFGICALVIRLDSPGPAWFTQIRVGRNGQPFKVHKFRTMSLGAHEARHEIAHENESDREGVLFKIKADPRITRVGTVLRKYSLDELPQLVNVLLGQMSLIGPRPALPQEVQGYSTDLRRRLVVKPGMTGLWQVSGRSDLSWEETERMDLEYVDNWSWPLDLRIAARTVGAVLGQKGAY
jgi:exopolysaccharide biosynthesis polyprenyl glycosylphosphotransferase